MPCTLVDSNVLIDLLTEDEKWMDWSAASLEECAEQGELFINPIIYAGDLAAVRLDRSDGRGLSPDYFRRANLPWEAGFLAGMAFVQYRRSGGARRSPMPDFYVAAHAAVEGLTSAHPRRKALPEVLSLAPDRRSLIATRA